MPPESKKSLDETLDEISKGSMRSKIVRLREIFDKVEAAKSNGASNKAIVEALKEFGLVFDVNNFKNARSRILKERAMEKLAQAASVSNINRQVSSHSKASEPPEKKIESKQKRETEILEIELARPPGITKSMWSEMQVKAAAEKRKKT